MGYQNLGRVRLHYAGEWNQDTTYEPLDYVYYGTSPNQDLYIAIAESNNQIPPETGSSDYWVKITVAGQLPASLEYFTAKVLKPTEEPVEGEVYWEKLTETITDHYPYTHQAIVTLKNFDTNTYNGLSLINDNCVLFGNYCFGIPKDGVTTSGSVTLYSIGRPNEDITFTFTASKKSTTV